MKIYNKMVYTPLLLMILLVLMMVTAMGIMAAPQKVELGTAESFAILAGSGITVAGEVNSTEIYGDIGSHPTGTYTGQQNVVQTGGAVYLAGGDGEGVALQAKNDLQIAYNDAFGRDSTMDITGLDLGNISSEEEPLLPGVYTADTSLGLTDTLYLHADNPNDAFIFQMGSTLTTASYSKIELSGEATFCQVFWQVGSSATLGTNSTFVGHILAQESITATTGAAVEGQLLALNGAVALDTNKIINDVCLSTGSLAVTKNVTGDTSGITLPSFEITVTGDGYSETRTIASGETETWTDLVPGTYTVTEGDLSSEWTVTGEGDVTVVTDETAVTTVTNTYLAEVVPVGSLTVGKIVSGDTSGITIPLFEITVTGPEGFSATRTFGSGETYTWTDLVPGTYTVTEDKTGLSEEWTVTGEGTVEVVADQTAVATVTNTYLAEVVPVGSLTVGKIVSGDTSGLTLPLFEITVTGPEGFSATRTFGSGETYTWTDLVPGTYTVTEGDLSSEWTVTGEGDVTVVADETAVTTVTNTYLAEAVPVGSLTVGKIVSGDTSGLTLPLFEITVTGPEGFSATRTFVSGETFTWTNLVPGTYTVTEEKTGLSEEWTVTGEGAVEVVADQTAVTTITNTFLAEVVPVGSLTVGKIVSGDTSGELPLFEITVTGPEGFSATRTFVSDETFTWTNLVPGTYTVTEDKTGLSEEWTVTGEGTVEVVADQTAVTTVTNSYVMEEDVIEEEAVLPRTGENELLLLVISGVCITLAGGFFLKTTNGKRKLKYKL